DHHKQPVRETGGSSADRKRLSSFVAARSCGVDSGAALRLLRSWWAGWVSQRRGYYTDATDEQWALVEPVIVAWKARHPSVSGHDGRYPMRAIVDAIFCQNRSGCQWSLLPADFPPASAVKYYFYRWPDDGMDVVIQE